MSGASGFVGRCLLERLLAEGDSVLALVRTKGKLPPHPNLHEVVCDFEEDALLDLPFGRCDVVVHLAHAQGPLEHSAQRMFAVNVQATFRLLELARRLAGVHFCYASTGSVYGFRPTPSKETDACSGESFYARTKLAGEALVSGYKDVFDVSILRLFAPYGPGLRGRLISSLVEGVVERREIPTPEVGDFCINPIYIQDCVTSIVEATGAGPVGVLNVGGGEVVSVGTLVELIAEAVGSPEATLVPTKKATGHLIGDTSRLRDDSRFSNPTTTMRTGLNEMVSDYLRRNPRLGA